SELQTREKMARRSKLAFQAGRVSALTNTKQNISRLSLQREAFCNVLVPKCSSEMSLVSHLFAFVLVRFAGGPAAVAPSQIRTSIESHRDAVRTVFHVALCCTCRCTVMAAMRGGRQCAALR